MPKHQRDKYFEICRQWEEETKLQLEYADYSRFFVRNVNNYIAEYTSGKLKRKGAAFIYERHEGELGWSKNQSSLVIQKAAEANLVHGTDIREFIENHDDVFDFMLRTKLPRNSALVAEDWMGQKSTLQRITRYYIAKDGATLTKVMPPLGLTKVTDAKLNRKYNSLRKKPAFRDHTDDEVMAIATDEVEAAHLKKRTTSVNKGCFVIDTNTMPEEIDRDTIDFDWYVAETHKIVDEVKAVVR